MAPTKITVNSNGAIRVEGDFEIPGQALWAGGSHHGLALPLRPFGKQTFLRRIAQERGLHGRSNSPRAATPDPQAVDGLTA